MRDLIDMWKNTKMIMLTVLTAAIYAALLIPFKAIPLVPGITEIRPAQIITSTFSLLFGPAGAWGLAFGNLIGDFFGTLSLASFFGFLGNLMHGLIIYKIWNTLAEKPVIDSRGDYLKYLITVIAGGAGGALVIGWGLELLGFFPFASVGIIIPLNNIILPVILGPAILKLIYPRIQRWDLTWDEIMKVESNYKPRHSKIGRILTITGAVGGLITGNLLSTGLYGAEITAQIGSTGIGVVILLIPFLLTMLIGVLYML